MSSSTSVEIETGFTENSLGEGLQSGEAEWDVLIATCASWDLAEGTG